MIFFFEKHLQKQKTIVYLQPHNSTGLVVQLVRIHACHAWGRGFESRPDRQKKEEAPYNNGAFLPS